MAGLSPQMYVLCRIERLLRCQSCALAASPVLVVAHASAMATATGLQMLTLCFVCYSINVVIVLGMMQVSKKVPFDDPNVLNAVRGLYILSNLIIVAVYYFIKTKIDAKKGSSDPPPQTPVYRRCDWQDCD